MTLRQLMQLMKTKQAATRFFQRLRWQQGLICQRCGVIGAAHRHGRTKTGFQKYRCPDCQHVFSDTTGTCLHGTRITAQQFLLTLYELADNKSITSVALGRKLGTSQKRAWHMLHTIRRQFATLVTQFAHRAMRGVVESDEAHLGKQKNS